MKDETLFRIEEGGCGKISETGEFVYGGVESRIGEFPFTALIRTDRPAPVENFKTELRPLIGPDQ